MSQKIDPREVLIYLNELGYTNISAQQLKEFMIDLKKIMKYEHRKRKILGHSCDPSSNYNYSTPVYVEAKSKKLQNYIFEALHNQPTEASKAKMVHKREQQQIAVHISHAKKKNFEHEHCVHVGAHIPTNIPIQSSREVLAPRVQSSEVALNVNTQTESSNNLLESESSTNKNIRPTSKQSAGSSTAPSSKYKKSKTAVLRNNSSTKTLKKSDPVALYHQYQQEWKNVKFPGEDNHLDLRWAIREKLMDGPIVEKPLRKTSSRKKVF